MPQAAINGLGCARCVHIPSAAVEEKRHADAANEAAEKRGCEIRTNPNGITATIMTAQHIIFRFACELKVRRSSVVKSAHTYQHTDWRDKEHCAPRPMLQMCWNSIDELSKASGCGEGHSPISVGL